MPMNLTLENVPDDVYGRLKVAAEAHRRSLSSQAIVCLEAVPMPGRVTTSERLARELRAAFPKANFRPQDLDAFKREGRA
jgi:plasmid stability protein